MGKGGWGLQATELPLGLSLPTDVNPPPQAIMPSPASPNPNPRQLTEEELAASQTFLPIENGIKHQFNHSTKTWDEIPCKIQLAKGFFARGVTRIAFHMNVFCGADNQPTPMVAKFLDSKFLAPLVGPITREMLFQDAMGQVVAGELAYEFNSRCPPRPIHFLPIYIIEFCDRLERPMAFLEPRLPKGAIVKHNNNNGVVLSPYQTPQAFGHFTWEVTTGQYSKFRRVVVDMQGVGDVYTDPQIHTIDHQKFGIGNQGKEGVRKFISGHSCNFVCMCLGLTRIVNGRKADPWPAQLCSQVTMYKANIKAPLKFDPRTGASIDPSSGLPMIGQQPLANDSTWIDHFSPSARRVISPSVSASSSVLRNSTQGNAPKPVSPFGEIAWLVLFILLSLANVCGWGVARTIDKECSKEFTYIALFMQVQGIAGTVSGGVGLLAMMLARGPGPILARLCAALAVFNGGWISCGVVWAYGHYTSQRCYHRIGFSFMWWMVNLEVIMAAAFIWLLVRRFPSRAIHRIIAKDPSHAGYSAISPAEP